MARWERPSDFTADEFAIFGWDDESIDAGVGEGAVEHGGEKMAEVDGIVGDDNATGDQAGNDEFVAVRVYVFFGVKKAEGNVGEVR